MFGDKNYYCLVAGLKEFALEAENKGFDAKEIVSEIRAELSRRDRGYLDLFYMYYDVENLVAVRSGRNRLSSLGNYSREELEEELKSPKRLPKSMRQVIEAYNASEQDEVDEEEITIDTTERFERSLFAAYYEECVHSRCGFLKAWSEFDRNIRNLTAALTARRKGMTAGEFVVGKDEIAKVLSRSSAVDFGLKGELDYIDQVMAAVADNGNLMEKEHRIDMIKWNMAEELAIFDYFNINGILSYLVKINLVHRWTSLNASYGKEMFEQLILSFSGKEMISAAEKRTEQ